MISKEMKAELLVKNYTPMELAMFVVEAEEQKMIDENVKCQINHENMCLRDKAEYLSRLVDKLIEIGGV